MIRQLFACVLLLILVQPLLAQEPQMRCKLDETQPKSIYVGQKVTLVCELLVPGYFASAATFDLPDPPGVILMPPAEHPIVSSEDQSGTTYTVQRHELWAFPERSGKQTIPPFTVRFAYKKAPLDKQDIPVEVHSDPIEIDVVRPPGTQSLGTIIAARGLNAQETWKPEIGKNVKQGDAFTRTIIFKADDIPCSLLPPFPSSPIDGLGVYSKQNASDQVERGELHGQRQITITYVCKQAGSFQIPAVQLSWWDLDANQVKTVNFKARSLDVIATSAEQANSPSIGTLSRLSPRQLLAISAGVLITAFATWMANKFRSQAYLFLRRTIAPFRAVHLAPLNPTDQET